MHTPQASTLSTNLAIGSMAAKKMLQTHVANTMVLLEGPLVTSNEADMFSVSTMKGLGVNLVALLC